MFVYLLQSNPCNLCRSELLLQFFVVNYTVNNSVLFPITYFILLLLLNCLYLVTLSSFLVVVSSSVARM